MPKVTIVYGGPGTGKTHKLMDLLREKLKTTPAKEIAYVSFTRQGTYQGVDIAKDEFDLTDEDCQYFKTLHSLSYHCLELSSNSLIGWSDVKPIIRKLNLTEQQFDAMEQALTVSKNKGINVENVVLERARYPLGASETKYTAEVYAQYKKLLNKVDYTDMLELVKEKHVHLPVKIAFIDEAQDLTKLQWQVVFEFFMYAEEWIIAGDPNQAIFEWAGADVPFFLHMKHDEECVLEKSYRCSQAVWSTAKKFHACLKEKAPIPNEGTDELGFSYITNTVDLPEAQLNALVGKGTIFCLATQNSYLDTYKDFLYSQGIPFTIKKQGTIDYSIDPRTWKFVRSLYWIFTDKEQYAMYITNNAVRSRKDERSTRSLRERLLKEGIVNWDCFNNRTALLHKLCEYVCNKINDPILQRSAIIGLVNGNFYRDPKDIVVTNIHQVKGAEADYVFLCDNVSASNRLKAEKSSSYTDYLLRVFYVGVTRAKKGVVIWHRNKYCTVAPTAVFSTIGNLEGRPPYKSYSLADALIKRYAKELKDEQDN